MASIEEAKEIIKGTPISSIVSYYHPINKKGGNFEGICPFHGDSHPSLKINDSKGIYKCFACGAAGDSIKFVQDKLGVDFVEAIKDIANNLGVSIDEQNSGKKNPKYDMALRVLQAANRLYRKVALERNPKAFQDFLKQRGLTEDAVSSFQIGYAPGGNVLLNYLGSIPEKDRKFAMDVAKEIGLIRPGKNGRSHYDFYRDRVTFPIWDHSGKVRGFSSRAVLPDQKPKYLNSGESFVFDKGNILYGFNLAKSSIREHGSVIIVEGNMDAVTLHQFGFNNSVATMGVALSSASSRLLSNMTSKIYLAMDSDAAGIKAMDRINEEFLGLDIIPKFIDFSPAKDPDEFLHKFGRLELSKRIEEAPTYIDYSINQAIPKSLPESTDQKLEALHNIFHILKPIKSKLLAQEKAIKVAKALDLKSSNDDIIAEFKNFLEKNQEKIYKKPKAKQNPPNQNQMQPPSDFENYNNAPLPKEAFFIESEPFIEEIKTIAVPKAEKVMLQTFLTHPECILHDQITEILDKTQHFEVKRIVQWLKNIYLEIDDVDYPIFVQEKMKEALPDEIKAIMASSLFEYDHAKLNQKVIDKLLFDLNKKLEENGLITERELLKNKQRQAKSDEEGLAIIKEIQAVAEKLAALKNKK